MLMRTTNVVQTFPLSMASEGEQVKIVTIQGGKNLGKRLATMGIVEDSEIQVLQRQAGNGLVILSGETRLALGIGITHKIMVVPLSK